MKKRIMCLGIALIIMLYDFSFNVNAYSYEETKRGSTQIEPTANNFSLAKSPVYFNASETIESDIRYSNYVQLFHYEAPRDGYYMVFTNGSLDTCGKIYEENSILWWNVHYD